MKAQRSQGEVNSALTYSRRAVSIVTSGSLRASAQIQVIPKRDIRQFWRGVITARFTGDRSRSADPRARKLLFLPS